MLARIPRLAPLALLTTPWASSPAAHAAYSFDIRGGPSPGPGGTNANARYDGPDVFSGDILAIGNVPTPGIVGHNTPLNDGVSFVQIRMDFQNIRPANGGSFAEYTFVNGVRVNGFSGRITASNVTATGGTFAVDGYLGADAATFFGVDAGTELSGVAVIQLVDPMGTIGTGNKIAAIQLQLSAVPEPASVGLLGVGVGLAAWAGRRKRA